MFTIRRALKEREDRGERIKVAIIGMGFMGQGLLCQIESIDGMEVVAVVSRRRESCEEAFKKANIDEENSLYIEEVKTKVERNGNQIFYSTDAKLLWALEEVDCVVDCTGHPDTGAYVSKEAILNDKHVVTLNVEMDVLVGPYLKRLAEERDVIYTGTAGDEPGSAMELYDFAKTLGFDVLAMGKGKNNPIDYEATPESVAEKAKASGLTPSMLCSFIDGTNTMVELCAMANATGFSPDVPGGHGPEVTAEGLADKFSLKEDGGILERDYIVEYVRGVAPGVFVIVSHDSPVITDEMSFLKVGKGPRFALFRPFHLTNIETPISIARAVIFHSPTVVAKDFRPACGVPALAKRDLAAGENFDGIGQEMFLGSLVSWEVMERENYVPVGLLNHHVKLTKNVKKGDFITWDDIEVIEEFEILEQYREMLKIDK